MFLCLVTWVLGDIRSHRSQNGLIHVNVSGTKVDSTCDSKTYLDLNVPCEKLGPVEGEWGANRRFGEGTDSDVPPTPTSTSRATGPLPGRPVVG